MATVLERPKMNLESKKERFEEDKEHHRNSFLHGFRELEPRNLPRNKRARFLALGGFWGPATSTKI